MADDLITYITSRGVIVPNTDNVNSELQTEWTNQFGARLSLDSSTPQGRIIETVIPDNFNETSLMELQLPRKAVIAIIQRGHSVLIPKGITRLKPKDKLLIFTKDEDSQKIIDFFRG